MKKTTLQRYTLLLFFYGYLSLFFQWFSSFLVVVKDWLMIGQSNNLAIDLTSSTAGITTVVFLGQFVFDYLYIVLSWIVLFFTVVLLLAWFIEIIKQRKINFLVVIVIMTLFCVFFLSKSSLFYLTFIGVIVLYQPTFIFKASIFEYKGITMWVKNCSQAFIINNEPEVNNINVWDYLKDKQSQSYTGDFIITIMLNLIFIVGTVLSLGTLSGILVYLKDTYQINHTKIANKSLVYHSYWYVWLFKGFKWTLYSLITLGLYPLLGGLSIDYYQTRYACIHFENEQGQSFFDGTFGEYLFYRCIGGVGCILTLGLGYPLFHRYIYQYLVTHSIIDGHRLAYVHSIKDDYINFKTTYPLFICTFGLSGIVYQYIYQCYQKQNVVIDVNPQLYGEDEDYEMLFAEDLLTQNEDLSTVNAISLPIDSNTDTSKNSNVENDNEKAIEDKSSDIKEVNITNDKGKTNSKESKTTRKKVSTQPKVDKEGKRILKRVNKQKVTSNKETKSDSKGRKANPKKADTKQKKNLNNAKSSITVSSSSKNKKTTAKKQLNKEVAKKVTQSKSVKEKTSAKYTMPIASKKMAKKLKRGK